MNHIDDLQQTQNVPFLWWSSRACVTILTQHVDLEGLIAQYLVSQSYYGGTCCKARLRPI